MTQKSAVTGIICTNGILGHMFDAMPDAFMYVDGQGVVQAASGKVEDFFGVSPKELAGKELKDFTEQFGRCFAEFMTYHEVFAYPLNDQEHEFLRDVELTQPKHRYLQAVSVPVRGDDDVPNGRVWTMRDITAEREITELKIQYGGARGADELKSKFLTVVSHQMRTPLNSVRWNMELLLSGDYPEVKGEPREILQEVYKAVVNSISIVDDMLLAVDIEQRSLRLEKAEVSVADILTKVVHDFERSAALKKVNMIMRELPKDLPRLFIDADKIEKVLARLTDNAIRYTPEGGTVSVAATVGQKDVSVSITDSGVGIPEEDRPRMFERFFRSKKAIGLHPNASGLGLYISKFIIDAHDGKIDFRSEEGRGTTFIITLPRRAVVR